MHEQKLKKLREKIILAVPEILKRETLYRCNRVWDAWNAGTMTEADFEEVDLSDEIWLADVLIVIQKYYVGSFDVTVSPEGYIRDEQEARGAKWDLTKPLSQQSEELTNFLLGLLGGR